MRTFPPHEMGRRSNKQVNINAMYASVNPLTFQEAISREDSKEWEKAMEEEIKSLEENETWTLDVPPKNKNVVSCKWVYITKINADGSLDKRKARLVARGFSQKERVDFFETFSPVVRYETVRTVLAISSYLDLEIMQFDVKTAFLYGPLEEDIWMDQPEGFDDESGKMCHLKKGLYGLKQSP